MDIQPITYQGRTVAACTPRRLFFCDDLEARPPDDPLAIFVSAMCLYAGQILNGHRPGPYRDDDARAYARDLLIPAELLERALQQPLEEADALAAWLGLPAHELQHQLRDARANHPRRQGAIAPATRRPACR